MTAAAACRRPTWCPRLPVLLGLSMEEGETLTVNVLCRFEMCGPIIIRL